MPWNIFHRAQMVIKKPIRSTTTYTATGPDLLRPFEPWWKMLHELHPSKKGRAKKLPCAGIMYVSAAQVPNPNF